MCQGIDQELLGIDLQDERLNRRAGQLLERFAADPQASINSACQGWSETQAAYRFFDNPKVQPEQLLEPHRQATHQRIAQESVILVVQDTTELDFTKHPAEGVGLLNYDQRRGYYDHSHLAFTPEGLCLGVLEVDLFSRSEEKLGKSKERKHDPPETKESFRWIEGYRHASQLSATLPDTQVVSVADREADFYELLVETTQQATPVDFLIRAKSKHKLPEKDPQAGPHAYQSVRDALEAGEVLATRVIDLPATPKRKARQATLEIRAQRVPIKPPHERRTEPAIPMNVVLVQETDSPEDGTQVDWLLLTSLPIDREAALLKILDYYQARWGIEVFFRIFKTGCRVEEIQLETSARVEKCLMLYKIVAWRVLYLTYLGRECPELPCTAVFSAQEWQATWQVTQQEALPKEPPTLAMFQKILAELGGYNARNGDPPPGPQALWIGIRRMTDFALAWTMFQEKQKLMCN